VQQKHLTNLRKLLSVQETSKYEVEAKAASVRGKRDVAKTVITQDQQRRASLEDEEANILHQQRLELTREGSHVQDPFERNALDHEDHFKASEENADRMEAEALRRGDANAGAGEHLIAQLAHEHARVSEEFAQQAAEAGGSQAPVPTSSNSAAHAEVGKVVQDEGVASDRKMEALGQNAGLERHRAALGHRIADTESWINDVQAIIAKFFRESAATQSSLQGLGFVSLALLLPSWRERRELGRRYSQRSSMNLSHADSQGVATRRKVLSLFF